MKIVSLTIFGVTTIAEATSGVHTRWDTPSASPASSKMSNLERVRWRSGRMASRSNGGWPDVWMSKKCDLMALKSYALSRRWPNDINSWIPIGCDEVEPMICTSKWYSWTFKGRLGEVISVISYDSYDITGKSQKVDLFSFHVAVILGSILSRLR